MSSHGFIAPSTPEIVFALVHPRSRGDPAKPRSFQLAVTEYFTLEHGCMNAEGDARSATAQPPRVPNQARLPFRPWQQKFEVESPRQLANRAVQAAYVGAQPSHLIQINTSGESGGIIVPKPRSEAVTGFEPRAFSRGGVIIPALCSRKSRVRCQN